MKIAAIQLNSNSNYEKNLEKAIYLMEMAAKEGADVLALPENFSFVKTEKDMPLRYHTIDGELVKILSGFSKKNGVYLLAGSFIEKRKGYNKFFNTSILFGKDGEIKAIYRKIHLFDFEMGGFRESKHFEHGKEIVTSKIDGIISGLTICYDLRFPELFRLLSKKGAKIIFVPSAFTLKTGRDHWEILLRARAIENLCYIVAPSLWGNSSDRIVNNGRSMIVDPWGNILATAPDMDCVIFGDIDINYLKEKRKILPSLKHIRLL